LVASGAMAAWSSALVASGATAAWSSCRRSSVSSCLSSRRNTPRASCSSPRVTGIDISVESIITTPPPGRRQDAALALRPARHAAELRCFAAAHALALGGLRSSDRRREDDDDDREEE